MTKEEIVQALRVRGAMLDQIGCALQLGEGGFDTLMVYAADLIEAQAAEIEKLKAQVPRWIPVEDRLPEIPEGWAEIPEPVLYMMKNTKTIYAGYYGEGGVWKDKYFRQYADGSNGVDADDVLCWMYQHDLPQPPKGE